MPKALRGHRGVREDMPGVRSWTRLCRPALMRQQGCSVRRKASTAPQASPVQRCPNVREIAPGCKSCHTAPGPLGGMALMDRRRKSQREGVYP